MDDRSKSPPTEPGISSLDGHRVRYLSWGIFTVACDDQDSVDYAFFSDIWQCCDLSTYKEPFLSFVRLLSDLWRIAPWQSLEYYSYTTWMIISPAISSYFCYLVLNNIDAAIRNPIDLQGGILKQIQMLALMWLLCGIITHHASIVLQFESRVKLGPHLRAYFLPKLVKASLERNLDELKEEFVFFPSPYDYGDFIPGWESFHTTFTRLRHILAIVVEISLVIYIKSQQDDSQSQIFSLLVIAFLTITFLSPTDAVGGKGYTFWTKNRDYNRLMALFHMVFDIQYRQTLVKDGQTENLYTEYERVSKSLGAVKADTYMLGWSLYPSWRWGTLRFCVTNSPMALVALTLPWISSASPIVLMAIIQYAIFSLKHNIEYLRNSTDSFYGLMNNATKFYGLFDSVEEPQPAVGAVVATGDQSEHQRGMKIVLKSVSYQCIEDLNLTILPGQLVVITGGNGSGKTTLVKLLSGIISPNHGEVIVDDQLLSESPPENATDLFKRTIFIEKSEAIYPISLEENISMAIHNREPVNRENMDEALRLGGSYDIVEALGRQTVLAPCSVPGYSIGRDIGPGARKALKINCPDPIPIRIPEDHKQHIIASRAFLRLKMCDIDLVILDEATSAMDPVEEREVINNFLQIARDQGKTTIIVTTHNLSNVAKHADMILYMEKGKIVEQGTHEELMEADKGYSALYKAGKE
ncbi:hypothetical protein BJ912DRAFT_986639 [Pholiota molesta]|nr:hypothetical protein BJ912DRAFT_986639 [Pholiota molesta]